MNEAVSWNLHLDVQDGRLEDAKALMNEMIAATREEDGVVDYEWFVSPDGGAVHIRERYADSAATMVHLGTFGQRFAERFMACFTPTAFHVYGDPSDDVRGVLDGFGATYMGMLGGFRR